MKAPTSIRISAHDVAIKQCPDLPELEVFGDFKEHFGDYCIRIPLHKDAKDAIIADTLIHEILHAIIRIYNIDIDDVDEEKLVTTLGTATTQVYRDNPELLVYIQHLLRER